MQSRYVSYFPIHVHDRERLVTEHLAQVLCLNEYFDHLRPVVDMDLIHERADVIRCARTRLQKSSLARAAPALRCCLIQPQ